MHTIICVASTALGLHPGRIIVANPRSWRHAQPSASDLQRGLTDPTLTMPSDPRLTYTDYGVISRERQRRAYASVDGFRRIANGSSVAAGDLRPPLPRPGDEAWLTVGQRTAIGVLTSVAYPGLVAVLSSIPGSGAADLTSSFLPTVSIVFATLLSVTLSIEYTRLQRIQDVAASESADLALLTRLLLGLFPEPVPERRAISVALGEQISTLVQRSRLQELEMMVSASDPYGAISDVLESAAAEEADAKRERCRALLSSLMATRAQRLSAEALSLPQVHFQILATFGGLLLASYVLIGAATSVGTKAPPTVESCVLFGVLSGTYSLTLQFCLDLNQPFDGVYQVRRSAAATSLLSARQLLNADLPDGLDFERHSPGRSMSSDPRPC